MIVDPYRLRPAAPLVAFLTRDGVAVSEHGEVLNLDAWPAGYRLWASYETVYELVRRGKGEALCWRHEELRWRHRRFEDGWTNRPSDAHVIRLPLPDREPDRVLSALVAWRDWLVEYGAAPTGSTGSSAWSLLRGTLRRRLWCSKGDMPPLRQTLGGRQELGPGGQGRLETLLEHLDLPAAYASTLAELRYGGHWVRSGGRHELDRMAQNDRCVFARAQVKVPALRWGPLPRRPRRHVTGLEQQLAAAVYPRGVTMQGVWTADELAAAEAHGCSIMRVLDVWVHVAGDQQPFLPWWRAIQAGRGMSDKLGAQLAKVTGNALWGRFCMDGRIGGLRSRTIRTRSGRKLEARPLPFAGGIDPAHDLAETVSGRVRARLYGAMMAAGGQMVAAHTDGLWRACEGVDELELDGWRIKEHARRLDVLDPQVLRYWPLPGSRHEPFVVFSGIPSERAPRMFERLWRAEGFEPTVELELDELDELEGAAA